jgi:tRNA A37 methylthiotransferase MiaB
VHLAIKGEIEQHLAEIETFFIDNGIRGENDTPLLDATALSKDYFAVFRVDTALIKYYEDFTQARVYVECVRGCSNYRRSKLGNVCPPDCDACEDALDQDNELCPRGVPPGCGYCGTHAMFGPPKSRAVSAITNDAREFVELGVTRIVLGGPDLLDFQREALVPSGTLITPRSPPAANLEALSDLIDQIIAVKGVKEREVQVFFENLKANLCSREVFEILSRIPDPIFSIGVETGDSEQARLLGRPDTPEEGLAAIRLAKDMGFRVHAYFIHSLPGETPDSARNTLELMRQLGDLGVDKITLYKFRPLPGTLFENYRAPKQHEKQMRRWNDKIKRFAIQYNRQQKQTYVGQVFLVDIVESHKFLPGAAIGRLPSGGPAIEVEQAARFIGQQKRVQIIGVVSDRLLRGRIC